MKSKKKKQGNIDVITLSNFAPVSDPIWKQASKELRKSYFKFCAKAAETLYKRQIISGFGVDGEQLAPVKKSSRPDKAGGKPLTPHRSQSRAARLLKTRINQKDERITMYWTESFGEILGYHARGETTGPVRNIMGLSPSSMRQFLSQANNFWMRNRPHKQAIERNKRREGGSSPVAVPMPRTQPTPRTRPTPGWAAKSF